MSQNPMPPRDSHDRLADMVNAVYRSLPDNPLAPQGVRLDGAIGPEDIGPRALEILQALWWFANGERRPGDELTVMLSATDAGQVLTAAMALAYAHQHDDHPGKTWVGCHPYTEVVFQAAGIYRQAITNARRP